MDKKDLRHGNVQLLRNVLKNLRQATKPQLAKESGLSVVTVNAIMKILVEQGEAKITEDAPSTGGRRAKIYTFSADRRLVLLAYAQKSTELSLEINDVFGAMREHEVFSVDELTPAVLADKIRPFIEKYPQIPQIFVIADPKTDTLLNESNELKDMPLPRYLTAKLSRSVRFVSEISAAAAGCGNLFGKFADEIIVGIRWEDFAPPVAGILMGGEIYRGRDGIAGEIGRRFGSTYHKPIDFVREATRTVTLITRILNPNGLVMYAPGLSAEDSAAIIERAGREIPAKYLPTMLFRENIAEDCAAGMRILAAKYIASLD